MDFSKRALTLNMAKVSMTEVSFISGQNKTAN